VSTYWDVRCLDCDVESGLHLNHGDDTCRGLIKHRDGLASIAAVEEDTAKDWVEISISVPGEIGHVDPSFYKAHAGHVLAPVNEYRQIDGDCNERGPSYDYVPCPLPDGHEGDHDFEKRPWPEVLQRAAERRR
jgi:hypothetical protein